ncbi:MAG TPA: exodeoxyribonuclease VII small subunit [Gemmatimonadaceae bacterium]|nr:exodeoxyribonuclease VII small subunit [Gemmatimonadaceae bacterium]
MTFEESMRQLEEIVERLDGDDVELADALRLFEQGVEQLRAAAAELAQADARVKQLIEQADGTFDVTDFGA